MTLKELNKKRWDDCKVHAERGPTFKAAADRLIANKARYQLVEKKTGVPWWFIAVAHNRESNGDFNTYLGNGQSLKRKTTIVPKGRGPFATWEEGAIDALVNAPPYAARNKDWSVGGALAKLEEYNGLGYAKRNIPSPYIWAGTDQYVKGKFVADHVFDPNHVDVQLGCAGLLKFMGIFKKGAGEASAITATIGAGFLYTYWNAFTDHWVLYSLGIAAVAIAIDVLVYFIRNKKTNA